MRNKVFKYILCLCLALYLGIGAVYATEGSDYAALNGCHSLDAAYCMLGTDQLVTNADSVVVYETNSQTLMYTWNADEMLPPASLVKILTALIAIEQGDITASVPVTQQVLDTVDPDAWTSDLVAGETLSLYDLLILMLVDSGNDAAAVIASHITGDLSLFVEQMNSYARDLGCKNTNFVNVHGLHDENQYTTARDMARILSAALENETFREIFGTAHYTVPATEKAEARELTTENYLLTESILEIYYDARVIGSRTGITYDSKRCIASVAVSGNMELVTIVMGSESVLGDDGYSTKVYGGYNETKTLLDASFTGYSAAQLLYPGQILKQVFVSDGDCQLSLGCDRSVMAVLPESVGYGMLEVQYADTGMLQAPIQKGDKVSSVRFLYQGKCVAEADLYAMNAVRSTQQEQELPQNDTTPKVDWTPIITWAVVIVLCGGAVFVGIRLISNKVRDARGRTRSRQYRRSRQRSR